MKITSSILLLFFVTGLIAEQASAEVSSDSTTSHFLSKPDPRVTWGIDISMTSGLNVPSGGGPWISVAVSRELRIGMRLIGSQWMEYFYPDDSIAFDYINVPFLSLDLEWNQHTNDRLGLPIGLRIGLGGAIHEFREIPFGTVVSNSDSYASLEPWVGIRLNRGVKNRILIVPLRMFSFALGYRIAIAPDHADYDWGDLSGPVLYFRFSP